jgi:methylated-DNA-[protein]-cysteine S-methyltransferase
LAKTYEVRYLVRDFEHAIDSNPLSAIVPSHRGVGRDGRIDGYAGGVERKKALFEVEGLRWQFRGRRSDLRYLTLREATNRD